MRVKFRNEAIQMMEVEVCQQMGPMDVASTKYVHVASGDVKASVNAFLANFKILKFKILCSY
jgi:hypothetical protein